MICPRISLFTRQPGQGHCSPAPVFCRSVFRRFLSPGTLSQRSQKTISPTPFLSSVLQSLSYRIKVHPSTRRQALFAGCRGRPLTIPDERSLFSAFTTWIKRPDQYAERCAPVGVSSGKPPAFPGHTAAGPSASQQVWPYFYSGKFQSFTAALPAAPY